MEKIPDYIKGNILPNDSLNVLEITSFVTPPITSNPPRLLHAEELFSKKKSMVENAVSARVLLQLQVPNKEDTDKLKIRVEEAKKNGYASFIYPVSLGATLQLPFWVLEFWEAAREVVFTKALWRTAVEWIRSKGEIRALKYLEQLPWKDTVELQKSHYSVKDLAPLCSEKWLSSQHMDLFGHVLRDQLHSAKINSAFILETATLDKLLTIYRYDSMTYLEERSTSYLRKLGEALADGTYAKIAMSVSVRVSEAGYTTLPTNSEPGNHWTTVVLDVKTSLILYGDSCRHPPPTELHDMLRWWLSHHRAETFQWADLPSSLQSDTFSCPILSANSMAHAVLPIIFPLVSEKCCISARIDMLILIVKYLKRTSLVGDLNNI
jgi:hypothetical protein